MTIIPMLSPALQQLHGFLKETLHRMYAPVLQILFNSTNQSIYFETGWD